MAITDTTTQEFDWTSYGATETRSGLTYFDFISDLAHTSFTDNGGVGEDSNAYNNWRAINRVLAPQLNRYGTAIVGSVGKNNEGESWLGPANNGSFQSDGMYAPPPPMKSNWVTPYLGASDDPEIWNARHVNAKQGYIPIEHDDNVALTVTYQSRDPEGVPVGTFVPLMCWTGSSKQNYTTHRPFSHLPVGITHFDQISSIDEAYDRSAATAADKQWLFTSFKGHNHTRIPTLASAKFTDTIWANKYVGRAEKTAPYNDSGSYTSDLFKPGHRRAVADSYNKWARTINILWYAHDGAGNGMLVTTEDFTPESQLEAAKYGIAQTSFSPFNSHFTSTFGDGQYSAFSQGGSSSGQCLWKFPTAITSLDEYGTPALLEKLAKDSQSANTRWLVDPADPSYNLCVPHTPTGRATKHYPAIDNFSNSVLWSSFISHWNLNEYFRTPRASHILMFPTKMGSANDAALKTPQNFYMWAGWNMRHGGPDGRRIHERFGTQDIKFGDMVRTNCSIHSQPYYDGDTNHVAGIIQHHNAYNGGSYKGSGYEVHHGAHAGFRAAHMPVIMASHTGNVGVNKITYGLQEPLPNLISTHGSGVYGLGEEPRYNQFAGLSTSYNAINAAEYSVEAGTLINNNNAWTNPEYLMDDSFDTGAVCTATGFDNHLAVKLAGTPEGAAVDDSEQIRQLIVNIGGVKKLVLGPQVLKVAIYTNSSGTLGDLIAGPIEIAAEGNDLDLATRQVIFDDTTMALSPTYGVIKDSWCAFWVESP